MPLARRTLALGPLLATAVFGVACPVTATRADPIVELWQHNGVQVTARPASPDFPVVASDGSGGCFVGWLDTRANSTNYHDGYGGHIQANGALDARWTPSGIPLAVTDNLEFPLAVAPDGTGGVYFLDDFQDVHPPFLTDLGQALYLRRLDASGANVPGWTTLGTTIRAGQTSGGVLVPLWPDAHTGVMVVFHRNRTLSNFGFDGFDASVVAQRVLPSGTIAAGWPDTGVTVCGAPYRRFYPEACADGQGGALIAWNDLRFVHSSVYASRIGADGNIEPGWRPDGTLLADSTQEQILPSIAADGMGGLYVSVIEFRDLDHPQGDLAMYHLLGDGTQDPAWPAGGVVIASGPYEKQHCRLLGDGSGGVIAVWVGYQSFGGAYGIHLTAAGTPAPGWSANARLLSNAPGGRDAFQPELISDDEGGAYLVWEQGSTTDVWIDHILGNGDPAVGWTEGGQRVVDPSIDNVEGPQSLCSDGFGGAIVVWSDSRLFLGGGGYQEFAQRYGPTGIVAADFSLIRASAEPGAAHLQWYSSQPAATEIAVERRQESSTWQEVARVPVPSGGAIVFDDTSVESGSRYGYRLAVPGTPAHYSAETWLDIPAAYRFALAGARPNPASSRDLSIEFSLSSREPASIALYDLSGRRVLAHDATASGPGTHVVRLGSEHAIDPGIYWLRLTQGRNAATTKAVVTR